MTKYAEKLLKYTNVCIKKIEPNKKKLTLVSLNLYNTLIISFK